MAKEKGSIPKVYAVLNKTTSQFYNMPHGHQYYLPCEAGKKRTKTPTTFLSR
jgi:hypothetical protein